MANANCVPQRSSPAINANSWLRRESSSTISRWSCAMRTDGGWPPVSRARRRSTRRRQRNCSPSRRFNNCARRARSRPGSSTASMTRLTRGRNHKAKPASAAAATANQAATPVVPQRVKPAAPRTASPAAAPRSCAEDKSGGALPQAASATGSKPVRRSPRALRGPRAGQAGCAAPRRLPAATVSRPEPPETATTRPGCPRRPASAPCTEARKGNPCRTDPGRRHRDGWRRSIGHRSSPARPSGPVPSRSPARRIRRPARGGGAPAPPARAPRRAPQKPRPARRATTD